MQDSNFLKKHCPEPIKQLLRPIRDFWISRPKNKNEAELAFWRSRLEIDKGKFTNSHYKKIMLAMAE